MNSGIFALLLLCPASLRAEVYDSSVSVGRTAAIVRQGHTSKQPGKPPGTRNAILRYIVPALSSTSLLLVGSTLLAFALAAAATPLVGLLARRLGMLDMPGGRRVHPRPIPRPGGLAIAIAFGSAIFTFWLVDRLAGHPFLIPEEVRSSRFTLTAIAALLGMGVGLVDDMLELRARWQFLGLLIVAAVIVFAGIHIDFVNDPLSDRLVELAFPVAVAFTMFWIVGMNIALNFIDGLDGLAAGVAAIAALTLGGLALLPQVSEPFVAWMAFTLAGAVAGFLLFNFHPAKLFLGTTGVAFLGTMLAVLSIFGTAKVAAALLVLGVPIIDTFYVLVRRMVSGQPPFAPDRGHFHHRLLDVGLTHQQAVLLIYLMTAALGSLAFMTTGRAQLATFVGLAVVFGVAVMALAQRSSKAEELDPGLYREEADRF
ncbi:MAG: undecaprenyl/decaprenyl-phosphate alpha-N-acetylglucosaminyl 1-phosphate transferase [Chloroflexi bacterium]|nr:MAG: undecaprenyl/decaprenyl-phosphate alpha-N-acetylglucosaminyl 1-phosphate transferase [Chloroflexota bacterium]